MFTYYGKPFGVGQLFLKRCIDVAGALAGLGLTAFLFPFIALAIRLDSPGPLFFRQVRVGESGRLFTCWKFRSMYRDAERQKKELIPLNEMNGAIFKMRNDPRVTRVGKVLRRMSLDELPQFWNVLRGEMSLVGTRPPTPEEVAGYEHKHRKRICIKPGITGLWQVSGRNDIRDFDEVVRLDIEYIDRWSLWLDVKILTKTFRVLLARNGAY
jgi:exopolysaccharide biosynthesis polyprenyl glycosylphosphotransferase